MSAQTSSLPAIPPRSQLRTPSSSSLGKPTFELPVDLPPASAHLHTSFPNAQTTSPVSAPYLSPVLADSGSGSEDITFGKKKRASVAVSKDPARIRDGTEPRRSSSGIYTREYLPHLPSNSS